MKYKEYIKTCRSNSVFLKKGKQPNRKIEDVHRQFLTEETGRAVAPWEKG